MAVDKLDVRVREDVVALWGIEIRDVDSDQKEFISSIV